MCEYRVGAFDGAVLFVDTEPDVAIADGVAIKTFRSGAITVRIALPLPVYRRTQDLGDEAIATWDERPG